MWEGEDGLFPREFAPHAPIYVQIAEAFHLALARGDLKPGEKVPAVRELATQLLVNPNTVQRAYQELEREGLLTTRRGQGTFVAEQVAVGEIRVRLAQAAATKYLEGMADLGFSAQEAARFLDGLPRDPEGPSGEGEG